MPVIQDSRGYYVLNEEEYSTCNIYDGSSITGLKEKGSLSNKEIESVGNPNVSNTAYYNDVDEEILYIGKLLSDEKTYFNNKYGTDIYNSLIAKRTIFLKNDVVEPDTNNDNKYSNLLEQVDSLNNQTNLNKMTSYINTYLPSYDANAIYKHIEYTNEEFVFLQKVNFYINLAYYITFIIFILLLISSNNLYLGERFILYIFLAILPVLYPWFYIILRNTWKTLFPVVDYGGPNQVDTTTNTITMFSNNIKPN